MTVATFIRDIFVKNHFTVSIALLITIVFFTVDYNAFAA